ncbi:hypothetical protein HOY82DRAFT_188413 [Tuber indicum]|nr:hypothetical protein HOY82DRAFT_188413 [Tuber indicum]
MGRPAPLERKVLSSPRLPLYGTGTPRGKMVGKANRVPRNKSVISSHSLCYVPNRGAFFCLLSASTVLFDFFLSARGQPAHFLFFFPFFFFFSFFLFFVRQ